MSFNRKSKRAGVGFTLVEMLVVIAVIGILASMVAFGVSKVIVGQRVSNTRTLIGAVDKTLKAHWAYVVNEATKETGLAGPFAAIDQVFGADSTGTGERNRVIWIKMRLMEAFPESYAEIITPYPYNTSPPIIPLGLRKYNGTYLAALTQAVNGPRNYDNFVSNPNGQTGSPGAPPGVTESSACLLLALSVSRNGTSLNVDALGSSNVADSANRLLGDTGDGMKELVDGWGNPLSFFRFPTFNQNLQLSNAAASNASATNQVYADPVDSGGALFKWKGTGRAVFKKNVHTIASPFNQNAACYIVPTIVSWGPTGDVNAPTPAPSALSPVDSKTYVGRQAPFYSLGLDRRINNYMGISTDPGSSAEEADNIYSFSLQ